MPDLRFAPPLSMRLTDRGGGLNQTRVRTHNERLLMSLIRQHDQLSRMELGQLTGLSAQAISAIVRALEHDKLILAGKLQRSRVGPPTTPMSLNPDGAYAVGIKIGRKCTDVVLLDFLGKVRAKKILEKEAPDPASVMAFLSHTVHDLIGLLEGRSRDRLVGIGVAVPEDIETWPTPGGQSWRGFDIEAEASQIAGLPAYVQNDATAAAGAELLFGAAKYLDDFAYVFIGWSTTHRLILNHRIYSGQSRFERAGASHSLSSLERHLRESDLDHTAIWGDREEWPLEIGQQVDAWTDEVSEYLANSIASLRAFVDIKHVLVDGRLPRRVLASLNERVRLLLAKQASGAVPEVIAAENGILAKARGAASLPFLSRFMVEQSGLGGSD